MERKDKTVEAAELFSLATPEQQEAILIYLQSLLAEQEKRLANLRQVARTDG